MLNRHLLTSCLPLMALSLLLGVGGAMLPAAPAHAQPEPADDTPVENPLVETDAAAEEPGESGGADSGADDDADSDNDSQDNNQERFIPSEQISQDLGVSFPADI